MSIIQVRHWLEKGGCVLGITIVICVVFIVGLLGQCNRSNGQGANDQQAQDAGVVLQIEDFKVKAQTIEEALQQQAQAFSRGEAPPLGMLSMVQGMVLGQFVNEGLTLALAKKSGISIQEQDILKIQKESFDEFVRSTKEQLIESGKLKKEATEAQFIEEFKKQYQKTPNEILEEATKQLKGALNDPEKKPFAIASAAKQGLLKRYEAEAMKDEEGFKRSYESYVFKRIVLKKAPEGFKTAGEAATSVLKQLKESRISFEDAMKKYSEEPVPSDKKKEELEATYGYEMLQEDPKRAGLLRLKPGELSEVLDEGNDRVIYKLVKINNNAPKDLNEKKLTYFKQYAAQKASSRISKEVVAMRQTSRVVWLSKGYELAYELSNDPMLLGMGGQDEASKKKIQSLLDRAEEAAKKDIVGQRVATLVKYQLIERLYSSASPEEKKKLFDKRTETLLALLQQTEDGDLRLTLVDMYLEKKDAQSAFAQLLEAAKALNGFGPGAQKRFSDIGSKQLKLQELKAIPDEQMKLVSAELERWKKDKAAFEKAEAEAQAKLKAEQEKAKAELEKEKAKSQASKAEPAKKAEPKPAGAKSK